MHKNWECHACNKKGHLSQHCEFVSKKTSKESDDESNKKNVVLAVATINKVLTDKRINDSTSLILNSEATAHLVANWEILLKFTSEISIYQTGSDQVLMSSDFIKIHVVLDVSTEIINTLTLTNCIYTPDLNYNLISTSQLAKKSVFTYLQASEKASELVYEDETLEYADIHLEQYVLRVKKKLGLVTKKALKSTNEIKLWHARLDHIEYQNITKLKSISTGLEDVNVTAPSEVCDSCMKGKQRKNSFTRESN